MTAGMKLSISASLVTALVLGILAFRATDFAQALLLELASMALSLGIGLVVVNVYLQLDDKRSASFPLLGMIEPSIGRFHNDFFIKEGRLTFGTPGWNALIDSYQHNNRNPEAFSPEQRDQLYRMIKKNRAEVMPLLESIHDQLRELSALLGWSFSPQVMRSALACRLNITTFKSLAWPDGDSDPDVSVKLEACKLYMDIDATTTGVVRGFVDLLGIPQDKWLSSTYPK